MVMAQLVNHPKLSDEGVFKEFISDALLNKDSRSKNDVKSVSSGAIALFEATEFHLVSLEKPSNKGFGDVSFSKHLNKSLRIFHKIHPDVVDAVFYVFPKK
jgi:hypothetical protein